MIRIHFDRKWRSRWWPCHSSQVSTIKEPRVIYDLSWKLWYISLALSPPLLLLFLLTLLLLGTPPFQPPRILTNRLTQRTFAQSIGKAFLQLYSVANPIFMEQGLVVVEHYHMIKIYIKCNDVSSKQNSQIIYRGCTWYQLALKVAYYWSLPAMKIAKNSKISMGKMDLSKIPDE